MPKKLVLNESALAGLGPEKLSRLIIDEAERNPAFRRLVSAALAATHGPKAVATIIDKRLAGLARAKNFVDWEKAKALTADIAATSKIILDELAPADPDAAFDRLLRLLAGSDRVFERVDDSSGRLAEIYRAAAAGLPDLAARLDAKAKSALPSLLSECILADDYGLIGDQLPRIFAHLPDQAIEDFDTRFAKATPTNGPLNNDQSSDWRRQARLRQIIHLRQAIADHRGDVDAFIALERALPEATRDAMAVARRLAAAGRHAEALHWVRKPAKAGLKYLRSDDLADGTPIGDFAEGARTRLEIQILEEMGDRQAAQDLRWATFAAELDVELLRDYIDRLPDFEEFDALDRAFALASGSAQKYRALRFFLVWPRLDLAAKLVLDRRGAWEGRHYDALLPAAEALEADHPGAATLLLRALLDDILDRGRSPAYGHAARYLAKLDALAAQTDHVAAEEPHEAYRNKLVKKHGRKSGFWALVKPQI